MQGKWGKGSKGTAAMPGRFEHLQAVGRLTRSSFLTAAALVACVGSGAQAQDKYPSRNVRIVVPFPAGATTDMLARLFAQRLGETMGGSFIVENVGGGGGSIGADQVAKAAPDGYTLLFHNITFVTTTASLQYAGRSRHDIEADFVPVSVGAYVPFLLLAHPSVPAKDLKEFVEYAKKTNEPLFYGSTGPGSGMNLSGEILKRDTGIKLDHVPFRGAAPMVQDMLAGRVQYGGDQLSSSLGHVRAGALKSLALANPTRSQALPDVPTVRELGFPNLEYRGFNGFFAPKGTPEAIVVRLQQEIAAAAKHPDVIKRMTDVGAEPSGSSQEEMRELLREQISKLKPLIEELKLVVQ
jgi:tripartite-type tricarboxylate transporter receptor subunit TctC